MDNANVRNNCCKARARSFFSSTSAQQHVRNVHPGASSSPMIYALFFNFFKLFLTRADFVFLATMSLNLSKSFMFARFILLASLFAVEVSAHLASTSSFLNTFSSCARRALRVIPTLILVRDKLLKLMVWRETPVRDTGPSTRARLPSTMSMIVHSLPDSGP